MDNPHSLPLLKGGIGPSKNWGNKTEKSGGCYFFITLQFDLIYCVCGKNRVFFITFLFFSLLS